MAACVEVMKTTRKIPHALGIQNHDWLRALTPHLRDVQTHRVVSILTQIIYRCDAPSQYSSWEQHRKANDSSKRKRKLAADKIVKPAEKKLNQETLLAILATLHFRAVANTTDVYSLPAQNVGKFSVAPLKQHLRASAARPAALCDGMELDIGEPDDLDLDCPEPDGDDAVEGAARSDQQLMWPTRPHPLVRASLRTSLQIFIWFASWGRGEGSQF
jgi:hypothetical protein